MNVSVNISDLRYNEEVSLISENANKLRFLTFVVTIPGILWNGFLLLCFYRNKNAIWIKETKNVISNIITDFVISILNTVILAITISPEEIQWPLEVCYVRNYLNVTLQCVSLNHILALCIDRFRIAVKIRKLQQSGINPYKRSLAIWVCTSIIGVVPFLIHINEHKIRKLECTFKTVALELNSRPVLIIYTVMTSVPWFITNILFIVTSVILWRTIRTVQPVQYEIQDTDYTTEIHSYNRRTDDDGPTINGESPLNNIQTLTCTNLDGIHNSSHLHNSQTVGTLESLSPSDTNDRIIKKTTTRDGSQTEYIKFGRAQASVQTKTTPIYSLHHLSEEHKGTKSEITPCTSKCKETYETTSLCNLKINHSATNYDNTADVRQSTSSREVGNKPGLRTSQNNIGTGGNKHTKHTRAKKHVMVTVGLLLMVFNISMWPIVVGLIGLQLSEPFQLDGKFYIFVFFNQTFNPIIYAIRLSRLRCAMKEFLRSCLNLN